MLEAISKIEQLSGKKMNYKYTDLNRIGDHVVYYSNLTKCTEHFPNWKITRNTDSILEELVLTTKNI